jgi:hypothetical protein
MDHALDADEQGSGVATACLREGSTMCLAVVDRDALLPDPIRR